MLMSCIIKYIDSGINIGFYSAGKRIFLLQNSNIHSARTQTAREQTTKNEQINIQINRKKQSSKQTNSPL